MLDVDVEAPPRSEVVLPAYVRYSGAIDTGGDWSTIPRQVGPHLHVARTLMPARACDIPVRIINTGEESIKLTAGMEITDAEEVVVEEQTSTEGNAVEPKKE